VESTGNGEDRLRAALADRYRIESEIGSGGMATVYLAQDLKHDRKVAVKVLKPELAAVVGSERFLAEIRTTANLSHPHILPLFDSGEADGFLFYVMPYVEGESLRQRLDREGQLPVGEAVRIAGHVADALGYAHQQGVIHRDIKPGNILFQAGDPVLTDFGIALAVSAAGEGRLTETGLSLGTPYYMSPEQAAGDRTPTTASDLYSLGCVLYEMLTGDPPHTGSSAQAVLGKILLGEVTRPTKLRRTIPAHVEGVILRALERLPADRFESALKLSAALQDKSFRHGTGVEGEAPPGSWRRVSLGLAGVVIVLGVALVNRLDDAEPPAALWQEVPMVGEMNLSRWPRVTALAPDGSSMVYRDTVGAEPGSQLWVKERGSVRGRPLPETGSAYGVTYSPDGAWIAYKRPPRLYKQAVNGSEADVLYEGVSTSGGKISWMGDGTLLFFSTGNDLVRISEHGEARPDTILGYSDRSAIWVHGLSGEDAALVVECLSVGCSDGSYLTVVHLDSGESRTIRNEVLKAWYVPTGHLVWVRRDGAVLATPFDLGRLEPGETDVLLFEGVVTTASQAEMVLGQDGTVLFMEGEAPTVEYEPVWVSRAGHEEPVGIQVSGTIGYPALSPEGDRLAFQIETGQGPRIWIADLLRGWTQPLTQEDGGYPPWIPDGRAVSFWSLRGGSGYNLWAKRADGVGEAEPLLALEGIERDGVWSPDGRWLVYRTNTGTGGAGDIYAWEVGTDSEPIPMATFRFQELGPAVSPDGRFLAYSSDESGISQVYVRPFPNVEGGFRVGESHHLFPAGDYRALEARRQYDVARDGQRFIMMREVPGPSAEQQISMIQILNFFTELEERLGGGA